MKRFASERVGGQEFSNAKEWGPLEEMRTIYFEWIDDSQPKDR
eukprot:COSAG01_NODE_75633_length_194_cov_36.200000_1_plen_42_part_01